MYYGDMVDCWVGVEDCVDCLYIWVCNFVVVVSVMGDIYKVGYFDYLCVVCIVVDDQYFILWF